MGPHVVTLQGTHGHIRENLRASGTRLASRDGTKAQYARIAKSMQTPIPPCMIFVLWNPSYGIIPLGTDDVKTVGFHREGIRKIRGIL